jgi:hypothetical protein
MKAITIRQPWAQLIAAGLKTIETRSWPTKYRGPLAIHAGLRPHPFEDALHRLLESKRMSPFEATILAGTTDTRLVPRGAVVATATLTDVLPVFGSDWPTDIDCIGMVSPSMAVRWKAGGCMSDAVDVSDQVQFGDFTPGGFAWILDDVTRLDDPVPAVGKQGLWPWAPT